jgi:hypothetical protein
MQVEIPAIRKEILVKDWPSKSKLLLFLVDSLIVFIDCTIHKFHFAATNLITAYYFESIFQKFVTKICKLVGKIHSSRNQYMISFKLRGIVYEALGEALSVADNFPASALICRLYRLSFGVHDEGIKFAGWSIIIIKYMCEDC